MSIPFIYLSVAGTVVKTVSVIEDIPTDEGCLTAPNNWNCRRKMDLAATFASDLKVKLGYKTFLSFGT